MKSILGHRHTPPGRRRRRPRAQLTPEREPAEPDLASKRVRDAGGPADIAIYTCACGYVFQAPVSTTVTCPHCGGDQAW